MSREFSKTTVRVKFLGGPWDGAANEADSLDAIKVIFDDAARVIHAYIHQQDGDYLYSPMVSGYMSEDYALNRAKWLNTTFHVQTA